MKTNTIKTKPTALRRIIHSGFAAVQAVCKTASMSTLAIFALLLFALPAGVHAAVTVTTLAGSAGVTGSADGTGSAALFNFPNGVAVDSSGNVYVSDSGNSTIRKVRPGGVVSTLAGTAGVRGSADGTGSAAQFNNPSGVAVDSSGNVYVANQNSSTIRKVTPGGVVTTLAGTAYVGGSADGTGSAALFSYPCGVAVDSSGNVYVADQNSSTIRKVTPGGVVTTLAGTAGVYGSADGTGSAAQFNEPRGVAVDSSGNVYVADKNNFTIRKLAIPDTTAPVVAAHANVTVEATSAAGATVAYDAGNATDAVGVTSITYSQNSGTVFSIGVTTVTITAQDSANNTGTGTFTVTVVDTTAPVVAAHANVTVAATSPAGATVTYDAGSATDAVGVTSLTYSQNSGTVFSIGVTTVTITAQDAANNTGTGTFTVTVVQGNIPLVVTAQPVNQRDLAFGTSAHFAVSADGTGLKFQWSKDGKAIPGAIGASLSVNAVTTANAGVYTCRVSNITGRVITEAVVLSVVDPSLLIYKVAGNGKTNRMAETIESSVSGLLILDRAGQQGAFVWTGKQGRQKVYWVERRTDLATHSTGPVLNSTTVVVAYQTAGDYPDVEHNLVWLRGGDALVKLSALDHTIAPAVMAGTIGRLILGDNPITQTLSVSLVLDKIRSTASRANSDDMEAAISRIVGVLNAEGFLDSEQ